jgi:DNA-binding response OmpR family regulator
MSNSSPRRTVVVADDDPDIRQLVVLAVTRAGGVVTAEVSSGRAALDAIRRTMPELAVLDVSMPEMSGLEVCRVLRADPATSAISIMILSAAVHPVAVQDGLSAGADAYVQKPFSPKKLSAQIRAMLPQLEESG